MGVKGLSKLIKENQPNAIQTRSLSELRDSVIAVDTNYYIYKYTISTDDYIKKFASQYLHLVSFGIKPLYVFDGKPPSEKQKVIDKRKKVNIKKNIEVNNSKIKTLKNYFKENNIPYLECLAEADFICSQLSRRDIIRGCISDDMDFLTLGCKYLYREYYQYSDKIVEYSLDEILKDITQEQLVDISIFLGCDYCDRVHDYVNRCHSINVYNLFKEHSTLDNVWNYLYDNNMFIYVDSEKAEIVKSQWPKAREILQNNNNFNYEDMGERIEKVLEQLSETNDDIDNIKEYVSSKFVITKYSTQTTTKSKFINTLKNNMFAVLI
jgi:flap endonuclease-1